jgi:BMFP domain-containing protein YqiC
MNETDETILKLLIENSDLKQKINELEAKLKEMYWQQQEQD